MCLKYVLKLILKLRKILTIVIIKYSLAIIFSYLNWIKSSLKNVAQRSAVFNEDSAVKMPYIALKVLCTQMLSAPATLFSYDWFNLFIPSQEPMKSLYVIYHTGMAGFAAMS